MLSIFSHLYVFSGEMSVQFFGPFFDWVTYFSGIELQELPVYRYIFFHLFLLVGAGGEGGGRGDRDGEYM